MSAALKTLSPEDRRLARLEYRMRYLPLGIDRAREKLLRLEGEAIVLGLRDLVQLRNSHHAGDLIATEWMKRLGIEP